MNNVTSKKRKEFHGRMNYLILPQLFEGSPFRLTLEGEKSDLSIRGRTFFLGSVSGIPFFSPVYIFSFFCYLRHVSGLIGIDFPFPELQTRNDCVIHILFFTLYRFFILIIFKVAFTREP